jgi:multidrug efflux pump subunit AcrA (membrane-fusion protein)
MKISTLQRNALMAVAALAILALLIWGYSEGKAEREMERQREAPVEAPHRVFASNGETVIKLDAEELDAGGVVVAPLSGIPYRETVEAFGMVIDAQDLVDLRGNFENAQAQLRRAQAARDDARWEFEREKKLGGQKNVVSAETVQKAESAYLVEDANVAAADSALRTLQLNVLQRYGETLAKALLDDAPEFERLRQRRCFLVQITLPAGLKFLSSPGDIVLQSSQGDDHAAKFYADAPRTDPRLQGRSFYCLAEADDGGLAPGMTVAASIPRGPQKKGVLFPETGVVWLHGKAWGYAQIQPGEFTRREISTQQPAKGGWIQPEGFGAGASFVTQSPQVLLSEEYRSQLATGEEADGK